MIFMKCLTTYGHKISYAQVQKEDEAEEVGGGEGQEGGGIVWSESGWWKIGNLMTLLVTSLYMKKV